MLNWWTNLLSQVDLITCDETCLGLDKIPLELGIKVNKESAQINSGKELLSGKEISIEIPQGVGLDPLIGFSFITVAYAKEVLKYCSMEEGWSIKSTAWH